MKHFYKKWKKEIHNKFLTAIGVGILMISTFSQSNAQMINTYSFSALTGTFTPLVGATNSGVVLTADFGLSGVLPIGFNFFYDGAYVSNFRATADGVLLLASDGTATATNNLATTTATQRPGLAPLWDDHACTEGIKYQVNGVAPNRTLTVEWLNMEWRYTATEPIISFQVILYETTNVIDFIYRQDAGAPTLPTASIGIMGNTNGDFISLQDVSAAPAISTTTSFNTIAAKPATNQVYRFTPSNPPAPDIFLTATPPNCTNGSEVDLLGGAPPADVTWYWQTTALGTSTSDPYTGPKFYPVNGWVYANAYNAALNAWSFSSDSIEITNIPTAATPPAPVALENPACATTGTSISIATAPAGTTYYWQGTDNQSISMTNDAASIYPISSSGTYYVRAFETGTGCWSDVNSVSVTINSIIPTAPIVTEENVYACTGASSVMASAQDGQIPGSLTTNLAPNNGCSGGAMFDLNAPASNVTITGFEVIPAATNASASINVYMKTGTYAGSETVAANWTLVGTYNYSATINVPILIDIADFMIPPGQITGIYLNGNIRYITGAATYTNTDLELNAGAGLCANFGTVNAGRSFCGIVHYIAGVDGDINWYDAMTGGNLLGTGSPFEVVGTSLLPSAVTGEYQIYAGANYLGCNSTSTTEVTINVNPVNVVIDPINVNCNNAGNGSFVIGTSTCGNAPFSYSVNGGAFGPAPTNLTVGTHTVIVQDGGSNLSAEYTIEIFDALAPNGLIINTFNNSSVDLSWLAGNSETSWNIEWGTPGFTPGTGTELGSDIATDTNFLVTGLDGNTEYEFYISANCGGTTVTGDWISITETTLCNPLAAQGFCENFASDSNTEACWSVINANGDIDAWDMNYTVNPFNGDQVAMLYTDFNAGNNDDWLITPGLILTNNEIMSFNFRVQSAGEPNDFEVLLSTTGTNPADFTDTLMSLNSYNNIVYQDTAINLSAYSGTCYIAFHVPSGGLDGWRLYIDQVCVDICTPAPGIDGTVDVCRLDGSLDLNTVITQGENNGVWQFTPNASALTDSDLNVSAIPDGTFSAQYIVTTACTVDTTVATFNVFPASSAGTNGQINVCKNQPVNLLAGLSGLVDHGGTWYNPSNTALSSGQITSGLLPGQFNYNYITSNGVCPNDTANVILNISATCDWTRIEELNSAAIRVYPNPSTGLFYISNSDASQNFNYEVLDLNGRVISETTKEVNGSATIEVDLTNVENGIYMIKLFNESGAKLVRVVKQ